MGSPVGLYTLETRCESVDSICGIYRSGFVQVYAHSRAERSLRIGTVTAPETSRHLVIER